jgi:predicted phage terminase large subunit-like protein
MDVDKKVAAALYRNDLCAFAERAHLVVEPSTNLIMNWHHRAIAFQLNRTRQHEVRHLNVNQPPKTLKTFLISVAFVAFSLGHKPATKFLIVSYDEELAVKQARAIRMILRDKWFQQLFPEARIAEKDSERHFETTAGGEVRAVAITGGITGHGYDVIILDDIMKADGARSERIRRETREIFASTIANRWRNPGQGVLINVQQRLHVEDFTNYLLRTYKDAVHLCIPAISAGDTCYDLSDTEEYMFAKGELLEPDRLSVAYLDEMLSVQGRSHFAAQYLQDPQMTGGKVVDPSWFGTFEKPRERDFTIVSIDPAFTETGNYSAALVCNLVRDNVEIIHGERVQMEFPDLLRWIKKLDREWKPDALVIETIGSGIGLGSLLREDGLTHLFTVGSHGGHSKLQRMEMVSPTIEAGRVWLPQESKFVDEFLRDMAQFPFGATDDWPDALSQVLFHLDLIRRWAQEYRRQREPPPPPPIPRSGVRPWSPHYRRIWV